MVVTPDIQIPNERQRRKTAFWNQVMNDLSQGHTPQQIAGRYINPLTGEFYTTEHIYWIIRKVKQTKK